MTYYVYIMTNRMHGTLYTGVTNDIVRRVWQHRQGTGCNFTKKYGLTRLVYVEPNPSISHAIQREHTIKSWPRRWKISRIEEQNPDWLDLYDQLL